MRKAIVLLLASLILLSGCVSYSVERGLGNISVPSYTDLPETRYSAIEAQREEERLAEEERLEAERLRAEEEKRERETMAQAQAVLQESIDRRMSLNDYPEDLSTLTLPHVYRPSDSQELLDPSFTAIDFMLLNLGEDVLDSGTVTKIASSISGTGLEFIVLTGSRENQVAVTRELGMDAVTLSGGTVCFTSSLKSASSDLASFTLAPGKDIDIMPVDISDSMAGEENLDIALWKEHLDSLSSENIALVDSVTAQSTDSEKILALSSAEPSTLDWSIFTPYSYRTGTSWQISDHLNESWSDTYRATHFSEETDSGVTFATDSIHERLDQIYTQGLIEVSSTTMSIPGLSDATPQRFAMLASYVVP